MFVVGCSWFVVFLFVLLNCVCCVGFECVDLIVVVCVCLRHCVVVLAVCFGVLGCWLLRLCLDFL